MPGMCDKDLFARMISVNALKVMRFFQSSDFASASRMHLDPRLSLELELVMRYYLRYLLERELKSAEFLDLLRQRGMKVS